MGIYKTIHLKNLNRRKMFITKQIRYLNEELMKINKELERYDN
jgi:hypothetical protein